MTRATGPCLNRYARASGALFVVVLVLSPFSMLYVPGRLVVAGDATATAAQVDGSPWLLRLAVVSDAIIMVTEMALAAFLYLLFRSVSRALALLAAGARLAEAVVHGVNLLGYLAVLVLLGGSGYLRVFGQEERDGLALLAFDLHDRGILVGQLFFGVHLLALGLLVARSGYVPRVLGPLLMVAGVGYLTESIGTVLAPGAAELLAALVAITAVLGELPLFLWLLFRGVSVPEPGASPAGSSDQLVGPSVRSEPGR